MTVSLYDSILCRLCSEENASGIILYDNDTNSGVDICSMINTYLPIKVEDDGKFPRTICPGCNLQLHSTVQFFDLLIEGQKKIRDLWKEQLNREKRREKQQQQSLLISKNRPQLIQTDIQVASNQAGTLTIQDSSAVVSGGVGFDLYNAAIFQTSSNNVIPPNVQELDQLQFDQVVVLNREDNIYSSAHELALRVAGLEQPRKKRGRPRKQLTAPTPETADEPPPPPPRPPDELQQLEDTDGRRRRRRQIPLRFREAVQGKELERILKEEGVTDGEDERGVEGEEEGREEEEEEEGREEAREGDVDEENDDGGEEDATKKNRLTAIASDKEVIGHLETCDGQMGELIIVNRKVSSSSGRLALLHSNQKRRIRRRRRKPRFVCDICGRAFMHIGKYRYHKSFHTRIKFECVECKKRFTTKENFELHQKMTGHTGEGIVNETEEGESKETEDNVKLEVVGGKVACEKCNKTFSTKQNLEIHTKAVHEREKPYQCEICQKRFGYQNSLRCHILTHHEGLDDKNGEGGGQFPCDICGRRLNHPSSVIYHKEAEHNDGRRFVCDRCGKAFKHKQLLHRHQLVHTNDRPHQCQTCSATFKTKANLLNHQSTHTGEKPHFCEICGHQFAYKTSLMLHYRWHSGQKPYSCEVCKKAFSQKGNLQEHIRIHTGEKPYACMLCDKRFTTSSQFKLHQKRHTGERPWKCEVCGKTFLHKDTWKCHQRRHNNEKPFPCQLCQRQFSEHWALKKHMRLHTGERPYQCTVCGKLFADCSNLAKHRKVHDRDGGGGGGGGGEVILGGGGEAVEVVGGGGAVEVEEGATAAAAAAAAEFHSSMWNSLYKAADAANSVHSEAVATATADHVQQIIYVTYQDPTDPSGKVCEKYLMPAGGMLAVEGVEGGGEGVEELVQMAAEDVCSREEDDDDVTPHPNTTTTTTLQFTDEHGNPIHFTLNDHNQLQMGLEESSVGEGGDGGVGGSIQLQTSAVLDSAAFQSAILEAAAKTGCSTGGGTSHQYIIKVTPESAAALINADGSKLATAIDGVDMPAASYAFMIQNNSPTPNKDELVETFSTPVQIPAEYLNIN